MQINTNGKRNITLDFDAPKKFKLKKDGAEIPYIRTGKNSFRLGRNIDGVLDLEEVIEQPRIVKPMQLQAQQMALVNPNDVLMINQAAQQLEVEQNILGETQKRAEQTQAYLDIQQQKINETVLSVQGLENDNAERITATENGIFNLAGNLATVEQNLVDSIGIVNNEIQEHKTAENPHGITKETIGLNKVDNTSDLDKPISKAVQSALDEKADKEEIQAIRDELGEYQEKNDRFTNALSNYTGGLGNQLPDGGLAGQILAKRSDMSGDAEWVDSSASITIDDELSLESENPVQNKVVTNAFAEKQDTISDIAEIRTNAQAGKQASDTIATYGDIVTHNVNEFASAAQGALADTALQPNDNISELNNDAGYVTSSDLPTVNNSTITFTQGGVNKGSFTLNQATGATIALDAGGGGGSYSEGTGINITNNVISVTSAISSGAAAGLTAVQPSSLAAVATSGDYNDLSNKPTIPAAQVNSDWNASSGVAQILNKPTGVSEFTNDSGYITSDDLTGYATESYVTTEVGRKQDTLVSGTNIKTVNNSSILGSGNIDIHGVWGNITGTLSDQSDLQTALSAKANDSDVVHKNRDEIIRGELTFTEFTHYKTDIAYTETPSVNKYGGFNFIDKNDSEISSFYTGLYTKGTGLAGFNLKNKSGNTALLALRYNASGTFYTEVPTPTEDTNTSKQIDTVGARNTKLAKYLPLSGGTLTGSLTITKNAPSVFLRNTEITKGTAPSSTKLTPMAFSDKDGKLMGVVRHQYGTNKDSIMELLAFKANANSDTEKATLSITYPASGDPYAKAPASDVNGSIVTTVAKGSNTNGYYLKLGNGLLLQWGTFPTDRSSNPRTITYPQPFADNNYVLTLTVNAGGASQGNRVGYIYNNSKTKTNVQVSWANSNDIYWQAIGYY